MRSTLRSAFLATVPVLTGYLVLGFGFGVILKANDLPALLAIFMSVFIYAGSMQYVAIGLLTGGASILTVAVTTLMVNARHLFYGISMLERYRNTGACKPYLIFALTDETYSLVCHDQKDGSNGQTPYYFFVSLFNHSYWILGTVLGVTAGSLLRFNSEGIDFALTALFLTVFLDQWLTSSDYAPAIIGLLASIACLLIFGSSNFLIPAMLIIALILCLKKEETRHE